MDPKSRPGIAVPPSADAACQSLKQQLYRDVLRQFSVVQVRIHFDEIDTHHFPRGCETSENRFRLAESYSDHTQNGDWQCDFGRITDNPEVINPQFLVCLLGPAAREN